ncbi:uncharacterized protein LOC134216534 isoform X2 [Armigeres subalbatus]|uniref:uncharacterized protein LOC134216534 isoform X2 n=1 Tax=Armigeres subalbatus TaxID=124917 RepID=UPI002ED6C003
MQRVTLQITFWMMVLLDSSLVFGRPMSEKRSSDSVHAKTAETPRYLEVQYDDYPMVVPKRAAMLLDRLMVALHHALERDGGEGDNGRPINKVYRDSKYGGRPVTNGMVKLRQNQQQPSKTEQLMKSYYEEAEANDSVEANVIPDDLDEFEGRKELLDEMVKN